MEGRTTDSAQGCHRGVGPEGDKGILYVATSDDSLFYPHKTTAEPRAGLANILQNPHLAKAQNWPQLVNWMNNPFQEVLVLTMIKTLQESTVALTVEFRCPGRLRLPLLPLGKACLLPQMPILSHRGLKDHRAGPRLTVMTWPTAEPPV